jgi:hypothetical protein
LKAKERSYQRRCLSRRDATDLERLLYHQGSRLRDTRRCRYHQSSREHHEHPDHRQGQEQRAHASPWLWSRNKIPTLLLVQLSECDVERLRGDTSLRGRRAERRYGRTGAAEGVQFTGALEQPRSESGREKLGVGVGGTAVVHGGLQSGSLSLNVASVVPFGARTRALVAEA